MTFNELLDRPIAYQRCFVSLGAGIAGALLLSQAVYWSNRTKNKDYWFYKTQEEWKDETGMTRYEQETARKKLVKLGVIEEKKQGIPCRLFFRVNFQKLKKVLQTSLWDSSKQGGEISTSSDVENQQANTENTTENTTENKKIYTKIILALDYRMISSCLMIGLRALKRLNQNYQSLIFCWQEISLWIIGMRN